MTQRDSLMQALRTGLQQRSERIRRTGGLSELVFGPLRDQQFTVTASWQKPVPGKFVKTYSPSDAFVPARPGAPRLRQSYCRFTDDLCRAILAERGVFK